MSDPRTEYDFACAMQRRRQPDLERQYIRDYLAANPGAQPTDLAVFIYEMPPVETARIVTRPATAEEQAQLKIAQGIVEAEDTFLS